MAQASAGRGRQGRRRSGAGTVRRLPSGRWQARRCEADGTRVSLGSWRTRADAEHALVLAEADELRGERVLDATGTVAEWAARWLDDGRTRWRPSTANGHAAKLRTLVLPDVGDVPLARLDRSAVLDWAARLSARGLAPATVRQAAIVLRGVAEMAVARGELQANPVTGLRLGANRRSEPQFLTVEQVEALAHEIEHPPERHGGNGARLATPATYPSYGLLVRFAAYTGLRAGETTALRRRRVNLEQRTVQVSESATEVNGKLVFGLPKSSRPRVVPIPEPLLEDLRRHLAERVDAAPDALVFTATDGGPLRHGNFSARHFRPAAARAGLPAIRWHDLRHSYASLMIAGGVHARTLMELMGHSSITVTMDVYGHLYPGAAQQAADTLARTIEASVLGTHRARRETRETGDTP